jgi:hypothetical protein
VGNEIERSCKNDIGKRDFVGVVGLICVSTYVIIMLDRTSGAPMMRNLSMPC